MYILINRTLTLYIPGAVGISHEISLSSVDNFISVSYDSSKMSPEIGKSRKIKIRRVKPIT